MKTVSFAFISKFPAKKVVDCFTNPAFARLHKASNLFVKAGIMKSDRKTIVRTLAISGASKNAAPVIAIINFAEVQGGKSTAVNATFVNVPDNKAVPLKGLGKTINAEIAKFLTPKGAPAAKAPAKKAPAKKAATKKAAAKKTAAKKPAAKKAVAKKPAAKKAAAKKSVAKKPAAKKAVAKKATPKKPAAKKPVAKKPAAPKAASPITIDIQ